MDRMKRNFPTLQHSHISTGTIKSTVPCSFDVSIEHLRYVTAAVLLKSVQFMKEVGSKAKMWRSGRLVAQSNTECVTIPGRTNESGCYWWRLRVAFCQEWIYRLPLGLDQNWHDAGQIDAHFPAPSIPVIVYSCI